MKIKKLIKLLECIEGDSNGKLPRDMYELSSYTKENGGWIGIDDMDFVHVMRAFEKMQDTLREEERRDTQEGRVVELEQEVARLKRRNDKYYEDYDHGLQLSVAQTNMITKLEQRVSHLLSRNVYLQERVDELTPKKATPKYYFSEIPNDCEGQEFIDNVKKYLNTNKYKMRVRGQHIKEEYKGTGATAYGQSIDQSTHLRVYIEEK